MQPKSTVESLRADVKRLEKSLEAVADLHVRVQVKITADKAVLQTGLRDLYEFFVRVANSRGDWTVADMQRLAEIRKLVNQ